MFHNWLKFSYFHKNKREMTSLIYTFCIIYQQEVNKKEITDRKE